MPDAPVRTVGRPGAILGFGLIPVMPAELAVVLLENDSSGADRIERALRSTDRDVTLRRIHSLADFTASLRNSPPDLVLCDVPNPFVSALDALQALKTSDLQVPFFLVAAAPIGEQFFELFRHGARGIIRKDQLNQLAPVVEQELAAARERAGQRAEQQRAEQQLRKNERLFKALIEHSYEGILLLNRDLTIQFIGPSVLGYAQQEWIGKSSLDGIHPADREQVEQALATLLRSPGATIKLEYRVRNAEGLWSSLECVARNLLDDPDVSGIIVNYRDITARKAHEQGLRERAELLDLAQDAILSLKLDGEIEIWNRGAENLYGWTRREAQGRISHHLLQTRFPEPFADIQRKLLSSGGRTGELEHVSKKGTRLTVASRWAVRRDAAGRPAGFLEINRDITERKRMEEQFRHTQKLESIGVLAGGVAHDFNNLLTGIMGNASLLLDALPPDDPKRPWAANVLEGAEKAANLTRQLLAYAGKGRYVVEAVDLSVLIEELSNLLRSMVPKHVQLRLELDRGIPLIEADVAQMNQLIMNLVINAAEAIPADASGTVLVATREQSVDSDYIRHSLPGDEIPPGDYVAVEVHDTGVGMTPEVQARIFDPFFTTKFTGRGLGLSAVSGIMRAHRGVIKVYSSPGHGTVFKLLFPAAPHARKPEVAARTPLAAEFSGVVLIADDEDIVLRTASSVLRTAGYEVLTASHGKEAVEIVQAGQPIDAILLDMTMPVMSGEATLRELQAVAPHIPVILSSGYNEVETVQRFAGKGLAGFLQKPYTARTLLEALQHALAPRSAPRGIKNRPR